MMVRHLWRSLPTRTLYKWQKTMKIINLGWRYWLPNPLLPFIWFRTAVPRNHEELLIVGDEGSEC